MKIKKNVENILNLYQNYLRKGETQQNKSIVIKKSYLIVSYMLRNISLIFTGDKIALNRMKAF